MKRKYQSKILNLSLGIAILFFGIYIAATGNIKNMQLGSERIIPASAAIILGIWIVFYYVKDLILSKK
jgi:hypothetical protein